MCISIHHAIVNSCCLYWKINVAVLNVVLIKPWVNTLSSDNKTELEVERKRAGLSFVIVNLGVPWALRPNSPVLSRSCPKHVLFFFFRRELPHTLNYWSPDGQLERLNKAKEASSLRAVTPVSHIVVYQGCAIFITEGPNAVKQIRPRAPPSFHTSCLVLVAGIKIHFVVLHLAHGPQVAHPCRIL